MPAADDLAAFVHTGGTTGAPKIAAHTHANQLACGRGIAWRGLAAARRGDVRRAAAVPRQRAARDRDRTHCSSGPARRVGRARWATATRTLYARFWKIVEHYRITAMSAVPTVYAALAGIPVDADISSLRIPFVGAAPLPSAVREAFAAHTGVALLEGYGLTEATCASTVSLARRRASRLGRARLPTRQRVKAVRVERDGSWTTARPARSALLVIGGPAVFAGYVTDPATAARASSRGRRGPRRLAGHRRPRPRRRRRVRPPRRARQGPHHPRRPQHRPRGRSRTRCSRTRPSPPPPPSAGPTGTPARCRSPTSSPPTPPGSTRRSCWPGPGRTIGEPAARAETDLRPSRRSRSPRSASTSSPRWPPTPRSGPPPRLSPTREWPVRRCQRRHEHGRLVITVTGAEPNRVRDALAGLPPAVRPSPDPPSLPRRGNQHGQQAPPPRPTPPRTAPSSWSARDRSAARRPSCWLATGYRSSCSNGTPSPTRCPGRSIWMTR